MTASHDFQHLPSCLSNSERDLTERNVVLVLKSIRTMRQPQFHMLHVEVW
jgi:hypothetical protein